VYVDDIILDQMITIFVKDLQILCREQGWN